jgi:hypothetical protein
MPWCITVQLQAEAHYAQEVCVGFGYRRCFIGIGGIAA